MSFSASIPVAQIDSANAALQAAGHGPGNFSVPLYTGTAMPSHAALHSFDVPGFRAAVAAIPNVQITDGANPLDVTFSAHCAANSQRWGADAPLLQGQVTPGLYRDTDQSLWWVIQAFDRNVFTAALSTYPALVRRVRVPGEIGPWVQPIDANDAYRPANRFTGQPDRVTHNGFTWRCAQGDANGNNVWQPGVFGWVQE